MPIINKWFLVTASLYQRSHRGRDSWCGEGNSRTQINGGDQYIGHGYHLGRNRNDEKEKESETK